MTIHDIRALYHDIVLACDHILSFTDGRALSEYLSDAMLRSAVERQLIIIGEALARASNIDPEGVARIADAARIVGLRNRLVHGYAHVRDENIWAIVEGSVAELRGIVAGLLPL